MRRERPHIVHTHTAKAGAVGRLAARLAGVPIVVHTYHGHVLDKYFSPLKTRAFLSIERRLAKHTARLIAVTPAVRDALVAKGIGRVDQYSVIRLGLDLQPFLEAQRFRGELRRELQINDGVPLVGIVGRLVPIKAHDLFLQAAKRVGKDSTAIFVIVGDGDLRAALETEARRLGLEGRVRFLGWRGDLARIYSDLDVVALSSRNEGSPVALLEAMAAGRAVVSTAVGGVPDVVEHGQTGLLVPPDDPGALADAISELLDDADRRRGFGEAARASVYPAYSMQRLINDIDALYQQLVVSPRPTS